MLGRRLLLALVGGLSFVALTSFGGRYQCTMLAVGCKHAVESCIVVDAFSRDPLALLTPAG